MAAHGHGHAARPPAQCENCALRRLGLFTSISAEELADIQQARKGTRLAGPGSHLYSPDDPSDEVFTLYDGWAFSYQELDDGRRHILSVHLPGDTLGVQPNFPCPRTHGIETLTDVAVCAFDQVALRELARRDWRQAWNLSRILSHDQALLHEHLTNVGRRTAVERVGFLALELFTRAERRGLTRKSDCPFPLTQNELGDALGLSSVHVSRMVMELRERGLMRIEQGCLTVLDRDSLAAMSQFRDRSLGPQPLL